MIRPNVNCYDVFKVNKVLNYFGLVKYIGIGVGLGGNVLLRHAQHCPGHYIIYGLDYSVFLSYPYLPTYLPTYLTN